MATLSAVIVPGKALRDGRHKVRISLAHNGRTRYFVTNIVVDNASQFSKGRVVKRPDASALNTKIRAIIQNYQDLIDSVSYPDGLTCSELVSCIQSGDRDKHMTLKDVFEEYISFCKAKESTKFMYGCYWNVLTSVINPAMRMDQISFTTVRKLDAEYTKRNYAPGTIFNYMTFFKSLVRHAIDFGYVQYKINPFIQYTFPTPTVRDSWLTRDEIIAIRDCKCKTKRQIRARDIFMLSYYLGGINIADLFRINFKDALDNFKYVRKKTERRPKLNTYVEFEIPQEAKEIILKYMDKEGYVRLNYRSVRTMTNCCGRVYPAIARAAGIKPFIYYSARKSFSQHAYDLGVNTAVIDYILGHKLGGTGGRSCLYSYIYVTPEMATKAIRLVLDNLK